MANGFNLSVKASKQGDLKGDNGNTQIRILGVSYGVLSPRDIATGQASGKRQHKPVTIFKEWGEMSTQLYEALVHNETLPLVIIDELRTNSKGEESVYMEIRLTNATISGIQIDPDRSSTPPSWSGLEIEQVSISFRKIEIENKISKTTAQDNWNS